MSNLLLNRRKLATFSADILLCNRIQDIVLSEKLVLRRVAESIGVSDDHLSAWLSGHVWGPVRRKRVEDWLIKWDAGEFDLGALKEKRKTY